MRIVRELLTSCFFALMAIVMAGCSDGPEVAEVTGVVKWDGQPVPFAYVIFQPVDPPGTYGSAYTDQDGKYILQFSESKNGALVGKHQVTIRTSGKDEIEIEDKQTGLMIKPPLPSGYKEKVELTFDREVVSGGSTLDFDLAQGTEVSKSAK
jgi:hypothetical protein